jgi:hypothetical protein
MVNVLGVDPNTLLLGSTHFLLDLCLRGSVARLVVLHSPLSRLQVSFFHLDATYLGYDVAHTLPSMRASTKHSTAPHRLLRRKTLFRRNETLAPTLVLVDAHTVEPVARRMEALSFVSLALEAVVLLLELDEELVERGVMGTMDDVCKLP